MIIYRPIVTNRLTQAFGANHACRYPNGKVTSKRNGVCPSGSSEFYPQIGMKGHNGLDLAARHGEPVYHAADFDGVMKIEKDRAGGIGVDVISLKPISLKFKEGTRYTTYTGHVKCRYWHLKSPVGYDGKIVKLGEQIGLADNTGASSGDHVHFGMKKCEADGSSKEPNNGYNGAFDFTPWCELETDAKSAAEFLLIPPPPLSEQEIKEIKSQLSTLTQLLNMFQELKRRL